MRDHHRATHVAAKLIADVLGIDRTRLLLAKSRQQPARVVAVGLEHFAVKQVGAAPALHDHRRRAGISGVVAAGIDRKLLNVLNVRLDAHHAAAETVALRDAVHLDAHGTGLHAVDARIAAAFNSRRQVEKIRDLPAVERKLVDALIVLDVSHLCAGCVQQGRGAGDFHHGCGAADFHLEVDAGTLRNFQLYGAGPLLEAGLFRSDFVRAGRQRANVVSPRSVALRTVRDACAGVGCGDTDVWNDAAGLICHRSAE